jgi:dipeptidyl aminopeptidase/acylaminoacyl peptidase
MKRLLVFALSLLATRVAAQAAIQPVDRFVTIPFPTELVSASTGQRIAWVLDDKGVRNVWGAEGPAWTPKQLTTFTDDDGQALTQLGFTPDGNTLVFVRGGDHGSNWASPGGIEPNPASGTTRTRVEIWTVAWAGGDGKSLTPGDEPQISPKGDRLAFTRDGQAWSIALTPEAKPEALFFARGRTSDLSWSPDGASLAFVSNRGGYSLLGLYSTANAPIKWLAPTTDRVSTPVWSPDGKRIAYVAEPGQGGAPQTILERHPRPWSLRVVDAVSGVSKTAWASPNTLLGSRPRTQGGANLAWGAGDRLVFLANMDNWPHLYSVPAAGGAEAMLLTPGNFMVEFVTLSPDNRFVVYNANTGTEASDDDRRHLFKVPVDAAQPVQLTRGTDIEWGAVATGDGRQVALLSSGARRPPQPAIVSIDGGTPKLLGGDRIPADFPASALVTPERVVIPSIDGLPVHLQLFKRNDLGPGKHPAIVYVHGGPPRQMLLGYHYWHYYASDYAVNQYLASQGFVVVAVNYRLGIGYGDRFMNPDRAGSTGASEYMDVQAAAHYLRGRADVDAERIGIWGGSYGGYLTALALARNSDLFAAGVDIHGVHDRTSDLTRLSNVSLRPEKPADLEQAIMVMWQSSPVADMATWKSPVLLIHGDDDRNVQISQTVDLAQRLRAQGVRFEEMLIPDEIHDFLRYKTWIDVSRAVTDFLIRELKEKP